jgi:hypothetical protein
MLATLNANRIVNPQRAFERETKKICEEEEVPWTTILD